MNSLISPIELHVVLAGLIVQISESTRPLILLADILGFKVGQHRQRVNWRLAPEAVRDIGPHRDLRIAEPPLAEAVITHLAVTGLVVGPAGGVKNELPAKNLGKGNQANGGSIYRP